MIAANPSLRSDIDKDVVRPADVFHTGLLVHKWDIYNAGEQEAKIVAEVKEIEADWQSSEFTFSRFQDVLLNGTEIILKIEDSVVVFCCLLSN
jgi:hypothetical protein